MTRVLLILRPGVELYPPTLNQISILVERGFGVSVIDSGPTPLDAQRHKLPEGVWHHRISTAGPNTGLLRRVVDLRRYVGSVRAMVRSRKPHIIIAFDAEASWALGRLARQLGMRLIWHFHELPEPQSAGITVHIANTWVQGHADTPDLIVFPDQGRADCFRRAAQGSVAPLTVVANCPRPMAAPPTATDPLLRKGIGDGAFVVLYHGAVGPDHALKQAIRSMPRWPQDAHFVMKGHGRPAFAANLKALAHEHGVHHRVHVVDPGFQSYRDHCLALSEGDVGWTVLEPVCDNWRYAATASNKRFECMALGLPQISDRNPGVPELIEGNDCGLCIDYNDMDAIAAAVSSLSENRHQREHMSAAGRTLHQTLFNYDAQFADVLNRIEAWTRT